MGPAVWRAVVQCARHGRIRRRRRGVRPRPWPDHDNAVADRGTVQRLRLDRRIHHRGVAGAAGAVDSGGQGRAGMAHRPAWWRAAVKVEVRDIRKSFSTERAALDGVSLTIGDGEFLALLGPSGSGKTTLLRVLAGLDFAEAGSVLFDGCS